MKFVPNMGKMGEIYEKSGKDRYIKVILKENNEIIYCTAEMFVDLPVDEDDDDSEDLTYIRVILKDGSSRLLTNDEIQEVFDYEEPMIIPRKQNKGKPMVSIDEMREAKGKFVRVILNDGDVWKGKCTNYYWPEDDEEEDMLEMGNTLLNQSEIAKIEYIKHNIKLDLDIEKIYEIYFKSKREKYIKVLLKENNETIYCKFDEVTSFWIDDENDVNTGTLTVILRVILKDGTSRRLLNDEIQEVFDNEDSI